MHEHLIAPGVRGWLESPASDVIASDCLAVCGWAFVEDATIIDVWSTGFGARRPLQCGIDREDVARLYSNSPNARPSGFTGYLELDGAPGERVNFDIWARLSDGRTIRLFQRALVTRAPGYDTSRIRAAAGRALRHPGVLLSPRAWVGGVRLIAAALKPGPLPPPPSGTGKATIRRESRAALSAFLRSRSQVCFDAPADPRVSVVLVVWNHADLTLKCLQALERENDGSFEVVISDNASTDETSELLGRVKGATIIRNASNLGFTMALNIGSRAAKGEFLLFVNNDAAVVPGTIRAMVESARRSKSIGAVGGKLVYPDGRLQEAGSIIWSDGSCDSYGRGGDPDAPEYNFTRPVDFCSAALLLTPRSLFNRLDGFDERYRPAYYDDADYCVRAWASGHPVVYEPRAAAIHYEFGSTSPEASVELQLARRPIFVSTHPAWLASQWPVEWREQKGVLKARVHPHGTPSVIVVDDAVPDPKAGSGFPRAAVLLDALAELGYQITLYATNDPHSVARDAGGAIEVVRGGPEGLRAFFSSRRGHDLVIVSRPHNMQYVKASLGSDLSALGAPCVYDAEAVYAVREVRRRDLLGFPMSPADAEALVDSELRLARGCAAVLAVGDSERRLFEQSGADNVCVVGHAVKVQASSAPFERRRSLLFVGAFSPLSPNQDAVCFFRDDVLPHLRRAGCLAPLVVAGANLPDSLRSSSDPTISWHAKIQDLTPLYEDARVFVAPTRYSAGISLKVIEAAARGVPVVCTSAICHQLGWTSGVEVLAADDASAFAAAVGSVYADPALWRRLRETALQRVERDYSRARFVSSLQAALNSAAGRSAGDDADASTVVGATAVGGQNPD